jgi:hypothetical protein
MRKPGDEARMAKMRARRTPFTDARDGRLKSQVRQAFRLYGRPLTTTELVEHCYCWVLQGGKIKSWHRTNITRVSSQGRPIMWSPRPELMRDRKRKRNYRHGGRTKATIELWRFIKSLR